MPYTNLTSLSGWILWCTKSVVYINTVDLHVHSGSCYWWLAGKGGFALCTLQIQHWSDLYRQFEKRSGLILLLGVSTVFRGSHKFILICWVKCYISQKSLRVMFFGEFREKMYFIPFWIHLVSRFFHSPNPLSSFLSILPSSTTLHRSGIMASWLAWEMQSHFCPLWYWWSSPEWLICLLLDIFAHVNSRKDSVSQVNVNTRVSTLWSFN